MIDINHKIATLDAHMFGANPKWTEYLLIWGEAGVVTAGKDSKTGNKGATMMFIRYGERKVRAFKYATCKR